MAEVADLARPVRAVTFDAVRFVRAGRALLDGVGFSVGAGGITALMGPNGAGKSLCLRLMAGLEVPSNGTVRFTPTRPDAKDLALVFQKPVLLRRSVRGNLAHALAMLGVPNAATRLAELLDLAGLTTMADRPARLLSGGEQQRLAMVRALAADPTWLLLDEPTASLDPASTLAIETLIRRAADGGATVILVTHDAHQAERLADWIVFLHQGRVVETSASGQFFRAPESREARAYLAGDLLV